MTRLAVLAVDPGPTTSGWVLFDGERVLACASAEPNGRLLDSGGVHDELRRRILSHELDRVRVAVEWVTSYGMAVGESVFETCYFVGRFAQRVAARSDIRIARRDVKLHLCGSARARDKNVRQALIDRFGGVEGKAKAVGVKKSPGPLYGVSGHAWAALAVAVTWWDTRREVA